MPTYFWLCCFCLVSCPKSLCSHFTFQQSQRKTLHLCLLIREYIKTIDRQQVRSNVDWRGWGKVSKCHCDPNKNTIYLTTVIFSGIALNLEKVSSTLSSSNQPWPSLPFVATVDRKYFQCLKTVSNNQTKPLFLEFSWCEKSVIIPLFLSAFEIITLGFYSLLSILRSWCFNEVLGIFQC